jgi:hypothetical protein
MLLVSYVDDEDGSVCRAFVLPDEVNASQDYISDLQRHGIHVKAKRLSQRDFQEGSLDYGD